MNAKNILGTPAIPQNLMKITTKSKFYLSAAAMFLIVTLAVPAMAQTLVPFLVKYKDRIPTNQVFRSQEYPLSTAREMPTNLVDTNSSLTLR
jgi:hypothetical protein